MDDFANHCIMCLLVACWCHRCQHFAPVDCISRLSGSMELTLGYTKPDIHCRQRQYECDRGINLITCPARLIELINPLSHLQLNQTSNRDHPVSLAGTMAD